MSTTPTRPARISWATYSATGEAKHIAEVEPGKACGCICPACRGELVAVNAKAAVFKRRPHFRHATLSDGGEICRIVSTRLAFQRALEQEGSLFIPSRVVTGQWVAPSGRIFTGSVTVEPQRLKVRQMVIVDEALATLELDDGRVMTLRLHGVVAVTDGEPPVRENEILLDLSAPELSDLSIDDIRKRLVLTGHAVVDCSQWTHAQESAVAAARAAAAAAQEFDPDFQGPWEWSRESALHKAAKRLIEQEGKIFLPPVTVRYPDPPSFGVEPDVWHRPAQLVSIESVELESKLGRAIPDVVVQRIGNDGHTQTLIIAVVCTHPVDPIKVEEFKRLGISVLEIDLRGYQELLTEDSLRGLICSRLTTKRWLSHGPAERVRAEMAATWQPKLEALAEEAREVARRRLAAQLAEHERETQDHRAYQDRLVEEKKSREVQERADRAAAAQVREVHIAQRDKQERVERNADAYARASGRAPVRATPSKTNVSSNSDGEAFKLSAAETQRWAAKHPDRWADIKENWPPRTPPPPIRKDD